MSELYGYALFTGFIVLVIGIPTLIVRAFWTMGRRK